MKTNRSNLQWTLAALFALAAGAPAGAHEGHHHNAMGTVHAVAATELQLETKENKLEAFVLTDATTYKRGDVAARREDVKVGERAVVMYKTKDGKNLAIEVKLAKSEPEGHEGHGSHGGGMAATPVPAFPGVVDKAVAVIGVLPTGAVVYFESEANLAAHLAKLTGRQPS